MVDFGILGPIRVVVDGRARPIERGKHRVLLASLLLRANRPVHLDELIDRLWPDCPPGGARRTTQTYVRRLREELGPAGSVVRSCRDAYSITLAPEQYDLGRFTRLTGLAAQARQAGRPREARESLRRALAEWRSAPLADVPSEAMVRAEGARLVELRCQAVEQRIELDLELGTTQGVVGELRALTAEHPLRERFWTLLMRVLCRTGRQAEALSAYHQAGRTLAVELGVRPGQELRRLHAEIMADGREPVPGLGVGELSRLRDLLVEAIALLASTDWVGDDVLPGRPEDRPGRTAQPTGQAGQVGPPQPPVGW